MALEEVSNCGQCEKLKKDLEENKRVFLGNFSTLKQKIITTDLLIKKYNLKCQEYNIQTKKLEEVTDVAGQLQRDCSKYEGELSRLLLEVDPLRKENEVLKVANNDVNKQLISLKEKGEAAEKIELQYSVALRDYERKESEKKLAVTSLTEELTTLKKELTNLKKLKGEFSTLKSNSKKDKSKAKNRYRTCLKHVVAFGNHLQTHNLLNKRAKKIFDKSVEQLSQQTSWSGGEDSSHSESDCNEAGLELERLFLEEDNIQNNVTGDHLDYASQTKKIDQCMQTALTDVAVADNDLLVDLIDTCIIRTILLSPLPPSPKNFHPYKQKMLSKLRQPDEEVNFCVEPSNPFDVKCTDNLSYKKVICDDRLNSKIGNCLESSTEQEHPIAVSSNSHHGESASLLNLSSHQSTICKATENAETETGLSNTFSLGHRSDLPVESNFGSCGLRTANVVENCTSEMSCTVKELCGKMPIDVMNSCLPSVVNDGLSSESSIIAAPKSPPATMDDSLSPQIARMESQTMFCLDSDLHLQTSDCVCESNSGVETGQETNTNDFISTGALCCDTQAVPGFDCDSTICATDTTLGDTLHGHCPTYKNSVDSIVLLMPDQEMLSCEIASSIVNPSHPEEVTDDCGLVCYAEEQSISMSDFSPEDNGHDYCSTKPEAGMSLSIGNAAILNENGSCADVVNVPGNDTEVSDSPVTYNLNNANSSSATSNTINADGTTENLPFSEESGRCLVVTRNCETLSSAVSESEEQQPVLPINSVSVQSVDCHEAAGSKEQAHPILGNCFQRHLALAEDSEYGGVCGPVNEPMDKNDTTTQALSLVSLQNETGRTSQHPPFPSNMCQSPENSVAFLKSLADEHIDKNDSTAQALPLVSLQSKTFRNDQHPPSPSSMCQSPSRSDIPEKSVAFLKRGRIIHPPLRPNSCDDHVTFIRKGRLVKNAMITGMTDDRRFLAHYAEKYNVMNSMNRLCSAENTVHLFKNIQQRLSPSCVAISESSNRQTRGCDTAGSNMGKSANMPFRLCDALQRLQPAGISMCSCCVTPSTSDMFKQFATPTPMLNLQDYFKPHGCCAHAHITSNTVELSQQHCNKTSEIIKSSQPNVDGGICPERCSGSQSILRNSEIPVTDISQLPTVQVATGHPIDVSMNSENSLKEPSVSHTSELSSPSIRQSAAILISSDTELSTEELIERIPIDVGMSVENLVKDPNISHTSGASSQGILKSPTSSFHTDTQLPNEQMFARTSVNIHASSRNLVKEPENHPESTANSLVGSNAQLYKMVGVEHAKPSKKKSAKKSLREKISDSLKYRKGGKLPIMKPTVHIERPLPIRISQQYSASEIDKMLDDFILKVDPLLPLPSDVKQGQSDLADKSDFQNSACKSTLVSLEANQSVQTDRSVIGQMAPAHKFPTRKRKACGDLIVNIPQETAGSQNDHENAGSCKRSRHDENNIMSPSLSITTVDVGAATDECDVQQENPPEIINEDIMKDNQKNAPCSRDTLWLNNSSSIFLRKVENNAKTANPKLGANVINGIIQLLEPLPVEGHLHVWQAVANRISISLMPAHAPLLAKKLTNWVMASTSDHLPAAIEALQRRISENSQIESVLSVTEKKCLRLIQHIRVKNNMQNIEEHMSVNAVNSILSKNTTSFGRAALCRFLVALFKLQENLEKARTICYDILFLIVRAAGPLLIQALAVWPEIFQLPDFSNNSLFKVFIHILMKKSSALGFSRQFSAQEFLMTVFQICNPSCDPDELVVDLLKDVKSANQETSFEAVKAIELLGMIEGWQWTNNCLVIQKLWPIFQGWVHQNPVSAEIISDSAMSNYLYLLGCLTKRCPKSNKISAIEVLKRMDALLEKSLSVTGFIGFHCRRSQQFSNGEVSKILEFIMKARKLVAWCIQEAALLVILMLLPYDKNFAVTAITKWLPNNEGKLSSSLRQLLNAVHLSK